MSAIVIVRAQPNPPGKDRARHGLVTNEQLNAEWVEATAVSQRQLIGDEVYQLVFNDRCTVQRSERLIRYASGTLAPRDVVRIYTGRGRDQKIGNVHHVFLNRSWYVWNNRCGDRVTWSYDGQVLDWAAYAPNPPEGVLVREAGSNRLVPALAASFR